MSDIITLVGLTAFFAVFCFLLMFLASVPLRIKFYFSDTYKYLNKIKRRYRKTRGRMFDAEDDGLGYVVLHVYGKVETTSTFEHKHRGGFTLHKDPVSSPFGVYTIMNFTLDIPEKFQMLFAKKLHEFALDQRRKYRSY